MSEEHWVSGRYVGGHGVGHAEGLGHTPGGKSHTKNTSHLTGDTGFPAGGAHDDESAAVRQNYYNDTAALQLFSHLEGDALNVAHLVPLARRLSRSGLVDALTAHYGSPGRLADHRRQFERTTRTIGEDPV